MSLVTRVKQEWDIEIDVKQEVESGQAEDPSEEWNIQIDVKQEAESEQAEVPSEEWNIEIDVKQETGSEQAEDSSEDRSRAKEGDRFSMIMPAASTGLYIKPEVKEELVRAESVQPSDYAFLHAESSHRVRKCFVKLESLPGVGARVEHARSTGPEDQASQHHTPPAKGRRARKIRYECEVCNKSFYKKYHLIRHVKKRTGDGQHNSEVWLRLFTKSSISFTCEVCMKSFERKSYLTNHRSEHKNEKPFTCDICKKRYSLKANLANHIQQYHMTDKPFTCKFCKRSFSERSAVMRLKRMHPEDKYACVVCMKRFKQEIDVSHQRTLHGSYVRFEVAGQTCANSQKIIYLTPKFYKGK